MRYSFEDEVDTVNIEFSNIQEWINKNTFDKKVGYLNSFAVVRACGTIERIFKNIMYEKLCVNSSDETKKYLSNNILSSSYNPATGNIQRLLQDISEKWKESFLEYTKLNPEFKSDLNSLVQLRNDFSHGKNINISIGTIIKYFGSSVIIMKKLYDIIHDIHD